MQHTRHCFWFKHKDSDRPDYLTKIWQDESDRLTHFIKNLTINNRRNLTAIQLFTDMNCLSMHFPYRLPLILGHAGVCPETLIITVTDKEWRYWVERSPLSPLREENWLQKLLRHEALPRLRNIHLELETTESRMKELRPIVDGMRQKFQRIKRSDWFGTPSLVVLQEPPAEWTWRGANRLGAEGGLAFAALERIQYRVVTLAWQVTPITSDEERLTQEFGLRDDILEQKRDTVQSSKVPFRAQAMSEPEQHYQSSNSTQWTQRWGR